MSAPLNVVALNLGIKLPLTAGQQTAIKNKGLDKTKLRYVVNNNVADDHARVPGKVFHNEVGISLYTSEKKDGLIYVVDNNWVARAGVGNDRNKALQIPAEDRRPQKQKQKQKQSDVEPQGADEQQIAESIQKKQRPR